MEDEAVAGVGAVVESLVVVVEVGEGYGGVGDVVGAGVMLPGLYVAKSVVISRLSIRTRAKPFTKYKRELQDLKVAKKRLKMIEKYLVDMKDEPYDKVTRK